MKRVLDHSCKCSCPAAGLSYLPSISWPGSIRGVCHLHRACSLKTHASLQVMSLVMCPTLLDHPKVAELYPGDAIARAKQCLSYFSGGLGAYTDSRSANRPLLVPLIRLISPEVYMHTTYRIASLVCKASSDEGFAQHLC